MFDYLRNLTKSAEEKRQEALNAYLDDALPPRERAQFERLLKQDADLRVDLAQRQALKEQLRQLPRRRVPRNFTLDPAVYGRPQRQPLFQLYPAMRTAAVLTAFFFILAVAADLFVGQNPSFLGGAAQPEVALVEVTRLVTETVVEEGEVVEVTRVVAVEAEAEVPAEEPAAEEPAPAEESAAEPMAAEAPAAEAEMAETEEGALAADTAVDTASGITNSETADAARAATALPTPSPAPTMTAAEPQVAATKSTVPRPAAETAVPDRAAPTVGGLTFQEETNSAAAATAVPVPTPPPSSSPPISGLRWVQIGLGALLIILVTAVLYVRRQTF